MGKKVARMRIPISNTELNKQTTFESAERRDRLRRVLMNRRAKATNDTIESAPRDDDTIESAPQDDLNDRSNHENEPKP